MNTSEAKHVMLDLETLGVKPGSVILSIGACTFDHKETFYEKIDIADSLIEGFTEDIDTLRWWNTKTSKEVKEEAFSGTLQAMDVLLMFSGWFDSLGPKDKVFLWAKGTHFDISILEAYYNKLGLHNIPWNFRNVRDYRTLAALMPHVKAQPVAVAHHALEDSKGQATHASQLLSII